MNNNTNDRERSQSQSGSWISAGIGLVTAAAIGGAAYYFSGGKKKESPQQTDSQPASRPSQRQEHTQHTNHNETYREPSSSYLSDMVSRVLLASTTSNASPRSERMSEVPDNPVITNLNSLLSDIFVRYIKLKEFDLHYRVFDTIFQDLHKKMKEVDPYYRKYSSTVQFAGSHYDNLRIKKPDEFDMDIVIGLPLNIKENIFNPDDSDFIIQAKSPGYVQLKMGIQYQNLHMRDDREWPNNKEAYKWKDESNFLIITKFIEWFEKVVVRALNLHKVKSNDRPVVFVEGVPYVIDRSRSGPAVTLKIHNISRGFHLDVDLVPALKFPENRWPISKAYRAIPPQCKKDYWMVVPKPDKDSPIKHDMSRSWRIALHNQERELMYDCHNLKPTIRLLKKLRDAQEMTDIASYYIKTLFFWEIVRINDKMYWRNSHEKLFKDMVKKLHKALVDGQIPYFWNKDNNLIGRVPRQKLDQYAKNLVPLLITLEEPSQYKLVAKYLLNKEEFKEYNAKYLHI